MNYIYLKQGDHLPVVGVLQRLLNVFGESLAADGRFGPLTHQAVVRYQRQNGLMADGKVDQQTWTHISSGFRLPIIDCIDVWDPALYELEAGDIRRAGGNPILIGGMSNGVEQAVQEILQIAGRNRIFLLRFHGHGSAGVASISDGHGEMGSSHRSFIDLETYENMRSTLAPLRNIFSRYGSVQFMHCSVGAGSRGSRLLENIADTLGVPASAGRIDQEGGGLDTFKFEGLTYTACPHGRSLSSWCRSLPGFPAVSFA